MPNNRIPINPKILANFLVELAEPSYIYELADISSSVTLDEGIFLKNNSEDSLTVTFESEENSIVIIGSTIQKIFTKEFSKILLAKSGANNISVSIYGR